SHSPTAAFEFVDQCASANVADRREILLPPSRIRFPKGTPKKPPAQTHLVAQHVTTMFFPAFRQRCLFARAAQARRCWSLRWSQRRLCCRRPPRPPRFPPPASPPP